MRTLVLRVLAVPSMLCLTWLTGVPASCADPPAGTGESTVDGIRLRLYMPKLVYTLGEPVVVETGITNLTEAPRTLAEPSTDFRTVRYDVRQVEGSGPMPKSTMVDSRAMLPPDYGWEFKAGEERRCGADLLNECRGTLPIGVYTVSATYFIDSKESALGAWHGKISTLTVRFSVVAADASQAPASAAFVELQAAWPRTREGIDTTAASLHGLRDKEKGGPFASYAGYKEAMLYHMADRARATELYRDYLREHPDVPYYSERAITSIADYLAFTKREFDSARLQIAALPDGYQKRSWLRIIDRAEAK